VLGCIAAGVNRALSVFHFLVVFSTQHRCVLSRMCSTPSGKIRRRPVIRPEYCPSWALQQRICAMALEGSILHHMTAYKPQQVPAHMHTPHLLQL
jgi:hypothetical protein